MGGLDQPDLTRQSSLENEIQQAEQKTQFDALTIDTAGHEIEALQKQLDEARKPLFTAVATLSEMCSDLRSYLKTVSEELQRQLSTDSYMNLSTFVNIEIVPRIQTAMKLAAKNGIHADVQDDGYDGLSGTALMTHVSRLSKDQRQHPLTLLLPLNLALNSIISLPECVELFLVTYGGVERAGCRTENSTTEFEAQIVFKQHNIGKQLVLVIINRRTNAIWLFDDPSDGDHFGRSYVHDLQQSLGDAQYLPPQELLEKRWNDRPSNDLEQALVSAIFTMLNFPFESPPSPDWHIQNSPLFQVAELAETLRKERSRMILSMGEVPASSSNLNVELLKGLNYFNVSTSQFHQKFSELVEALKGDALTAHTHLDELKQSLECFRLDMFKRFIDDVHFGVQARFNEHNEAQEKENLRSCLPKSKAGKASVLQVLDKLGKNKLYAFSIEIIKTGIAESGGTGSIEKHKAALRLFTMMQKLIAFTANFCIVSASKHSAALHVARSSIDFFHQQVVQALSRMVQIDGEEIQMARQEGFSSLESYFDNLRKSVINELKNLGCSIDVLREHGLETMFTDLRVLEFAGSTDDSADHTSDGNSGGGDGETFKTENEQGMWLLSRCQNNK
jgi:hypothetical protein